MISKEQLEKIKELGFEIVSEEPFRAYACFGFFTLHINSEEELIEYLNELTVEEI